MRNIVVFAGLRDRTLTLHFETPTESADSARVAREARDLIQIQAPSDPSRRATGYVIFGLVRSGELQRLRFNTMLTLAKLHLDAPPSVWGRRLVMAATLAGWLVLAGLIASLYVGHAHSPYGLCTTPSGHSVACAMLKRSSPPR